MKSMGPQARLRPMARKSSDETDWVLAIGYARSALAIGYFFLWRVPPLKS